GPGGGGAGVARRGGGLGASRGVRGGLGLGGGPPAVAGREGWVEAWVRIGSLDAAALDLLALGAEAEVIHPPELRAQVGQLARRIADLHDGDNQGESGG